GRGVAIGDEHLGQCGPIEDRPLCTSVVVADGVEDHAFAGVEADTEAPFLPADLVPGDLKAGALRLHDLERCQILAHSFREVGHVLRIRDPVGRVVALLRGDWHHVVILDLDDFHLVEVELDDQPLDRSRIDVLTRAGPDPRQRPAEPPFFRAVDFRVVPHDQASVMAISKLVTPRRRRAACQRGSLRTTSSTVMNSSSMIEGWTPLISSQLTTFSWVRETTASKVLRFVRSRTTMNACRSTWVPLPGFQASTSFLAGS